MGQERPLFLYFRSFQKHLTEKLQASAGFELRLPEYMHADHYTTTLAHYIMTFKQSRKGFKSVRSPTALGKELFSRQRWTTVAAQVVSCRDYNIAKMLMQHVHDNI